MKKPKSEFFPVGDHGGHTCAFEAVPNGRNPEALYVVFDGRRIAHRGDPDGPHRGEWVSMVHGFEVIDEANDVLAIYCKGERLH
jgi:hypothetical protein